MSKYERALSAIARYTASAQDIDRVAIKRNGELQFCVSPTTWWGWRDGELAHHYALDDSRLALSKWAREHHFDPASVLSYRPGRRLVLLDRANRRVIKGYRAGLLTDARARHEMAAAAAGAHAFRVPRLVETLPKLDAVAFEYCIGQAWRLATASRVQREEVLRGLFAWQVRSRESKGSWLTENSPLARWTPAEELSVLDAWSRKLEIAELSVSERWHLAKDRLSNLEPDSVRSSFVHRDLHDGQVLFDGFVPVVLDFDQLAIGDPAVDLGNLVAHHRLRALQYPGISGSNLAPSSADELGLSELVPDHIRLDSVCWYTASTLLRLALVYTTRPRWQHLGPGLAQAANQALDTLTRNAVCGPCGRR